MVTTRRCALAALAALSVVAPLATALVGPAAPAVAAVTGTVAGTVFRDYSADGERDALEPGEAGIVVTAHDGSGAAVGTATSGPDGAYVLAVAGAAGTDVRVEFTVPVAKAGYLQPGPLGVDSHGFVTFTTVGATGVDAGVHDPAEYCQANPLLVTGCLGYGHQQGAIAALPALRSFPYDARGAAFNGTATVAPTPVASFGDVGSTFALEHDATTGAVFAAAFHKQYAGYGPGGPGAVYRTVGGTTTVLATIPNAGTDPRAAFAANTTFGATIGDGWITDPSFDAVGTHSLGDMALTGDDATLWVVNLHDRSLYPVTVADGSVGTPVPVPLATGAAVACAAADVRPFALARHDGLLYLGETCSAQSTQQAADLRAYVYAFDPGTRTFAAAPAFETALGGLDHGQPGGGCNGGNGTWRPWPTTDRFVSGSCGYPQPWLTSLAFDRGNLVLGIRDRFGDQSAADYPFPGPGLREGVIAGDLLRACGGPATGWTLEDDGGCGGVVTAGTGNGEGPGGGEYYFEDRFFDGGNHQETSNGGVVQIPGFAEVVHTVMDPDLTDSNNWRAGGVHFEDNATGATAHWFQLYDKCDTSGMSCPSGRGETGSFGKASGLGDLVALCDGAPVELGDRVWFDADADGVQDAGEPALAGIPVTLVAGDGVTVLATVTTDADGTYAFSSDPTRTDAPGRDYAVAALVRGAQVRLRVPATTTVAGHGEVVLTTATAGPSAVDSDVDATSGLTGPVTVGAPGHHDHTIDMGYRPRPVAPPAPGTGAVVGEVFVDGNRNGVRDPGEAALPGVTVHLVGAGGAVVATTVSGADGSYRFDGVAPGDYVVRQLQPDRFGSTTANEVPVSVVAGTIASAGFGELPISLPRTGPASRPLAVLAAVLVVLGAVLVAVARRPHRA